MDDAAVKESRRVLRLVQDHLSQTQINMGVQVESVGLVDVVYHPESKAPSLNYVIPRKKTAWVPGPEIEKGITRLRELGRTPRVYYIEGLFPPLFAKSLRELGLVVEQEVPIMTFSPAPESIPAKDYALLPEMRIEEASTQQGIALWWYVWRNAFYDVITGGVEPVYIGRDFREITYGKQLDILLYRHNYPVGVLRLSLHENVGHISGVAMMKELRTPETVMLLYRIGMKKAHEKGCELIFTTGESESDRAACRQLGFVDTGSLVCYTESLEQPLEETNAVAEPVFVLR